jgi:methylenetetrahydrofolate dehydrogenase (NADP+) / methenyltetrahydrofolate cyclohydrolase
MRQRAVKLAEAKLIDGKAFSAGLRQRVGKDVTDLIANGGSAPGLATVLVGADPASQVYVRSKGKLATELGMVNFDHRLPEQTSEAELLALIDDLNDDDSVHGILVQLPLPRHIDTAHVLLAVDPAKDVDGFHPFNVGRLGSSAPGAPLDFPVPCTPLGVSMLLHEALGSISGCHAVVIGRSNLVGRPVAQLLLRADCTVTIAHSRTRDLPALSRQADILVVAIGKQEFVRGDWIKPGAAVIDVGINRIPTDDGKTRLVGDVAFAEALPVAGHLTPVPGGVGPMTVACLMFNTLQAARRASGLAVKTVEKPHLPVGLGARAEGIGAMWPTAIPVSGFTRVKI